jgi:hypothetical protein
LLNGIWRLIGPSTHVRLLGTAKQKFELSVTELSVALDSLQVYCTTLHEEVHVLYARMHPDVHSDTAAMGAGPSGTTNEGHDEELDLFKPPPSMNLANERFPVIGNGATKNDKD